MLQSTLFLRLRLFGAAPDLVLVIVAVWTLLRGTREGFVWAFVGGLALDLLSRGPLGLSSVALLLVCSLNVLVEQHVQSHAVGYALAVTAVATVLFHALLLIGLLLSGQPLGSLGQIAGTVASGTLLNLIVLLPIHWLLSRLYHSAEQSEVRLRM